MRRGVVRTLWALLATAILGGGVSAQRYEQPVAHMGMSFLAADPFGDMGLLVDQGFGFDIDVAFPVGAEGRARLRADVGNLWYGYERWDYCYGVPVGCRVERRLSTTNSIFFGGIGPELLLSTGRVQPYVRASLGFSYFWTNSSFGGEDASASTTNHSDAVFAWKVGGGVRVRVTGGQFPLSLDFGVDRHENGVAEFLTEGDIVDNPDGSITIFPNRSEAKLLAFRVGVSLGFKREADRQ